MVKLLLFCILLVVCWPLAIVALILYPIIWLIMLPFRLIGITIEGLFELISGIFPPSRPAAQPRLAAATAPNSKCGHVCAPPLRSGSVNPMAGVSLSFENKVVLITGGSRGIGAETVRLFFAGRGKSRFQLCAGSNPGRCTG